MSVGKGLQLERDSVQPVQHHFDTLTQKATLGFVIIAVLTFGFMTKIDAILATLLSHLNPCSSTSCLTLYEPASWSVVRWLSAVFLATLCILPIALHSMYSFARPGLTQKEQISMKKWMIYSSSLAYITLLILFYIIIPRIYSIGDAIHQDMGLTSQYDAVTLFTFALSIFWAFLMTYMISFATITAGSLGLITENNQDWWRLRILGVGGLVLLLSLPGRWNGANIVLLSLMLIFLEYSIRNSVRASIEIVRPKPIFDREGRRRFVSYVDCSCHGVAYPIDTSPENTGLLKYQALCHNFEERDHLIDTIARNRLTDIIIGGCDGTPLPQGFQDSVTSTRCQLRGLNLLNIQGALPSDHSQLKTEIALQLVNIRDPWTSEQRQSSCRSLVMKSEGKQIRQVSTMNWPEFEEGFLRIATHDWTENEFIGLREQ